ncbi:hypothetical protein QWI29_21705 [Mycolicibacterium neoaurum]|uniref:hypothetical protein n=1 Tax=Mycolicibacterium neoaurum TaxID=1795 RepID=UPI002671DA02|nr:hypothetical protein [Mycolicibacterium neoaurum]MDO3402668.1 hypothetical protein [Mycolicibacterium neoaurum]
MDDEMARAAALAEDNRGAIELTRAHCRHARIEMPHGNSLVGVTMDWPLGLMEVRCEHAAPPRQQSHNAMDLAVAFYRESCVGCPHRDSTGVVPNLATEVARRDAQLEQRENDERQQAERLSARRAARHGRRRLAVAGEGYVVRELAGVIDQLDADDRVEGNRAVVEVSRQLVESARGAPELFSRTLVESMLEMAADTGEPALFVALGALVCTGRCDARQAVEAALAVLSSAPVKEAADLLAAFPRCLYGKDLPAVLDRLVELAAGKDLIVQTVPAAPLGFLAAASADLSQVSDDLVARLRSDDDQIRADAAAAAEQLLATDPAPLSVLGPALISSCRAEGMGWAGDPHPSLHAARALAAGWRADPTTCVQMIEAAASDSGVVDRVGLMRVANVLCGDDLAELSPEAAEAVVRFCVARLRGDWGDGAADMAIEALSNAGEMIAEKLLPHAETLLGYVIDPDEPRPSRLNARREDDRRTGANYGVIARRLGTARLLGQLARRGGSRILEPVLTVFTAESGDAEQDTAIRMALLTALNEAATAGELRDLLPIVYAGLLAPDQQLRAQAIDLWVRCAEIGHDAIPANLADLAEVLLADPYVVVHQTMLRRIARLGLPRDVVPRLLDITSRWVTPKIDRPDELDDVVSAMVYLARRLDDEDQTEQWLRVALGLVPKLSPFDRERVLTDSWPETLCESELWTAAAVGALAEPELADRGWPRRDPLMMELLERPGPMVDVPLSAFIAISNLYLPGLAWRALELSELLQAVGRHNDCVSLAHYVQQHLPAGAEGAPDTQLSDVIATVAQLDERMHGGTISTADAVAEELNAVETAAAVIAAQYDAVHGSDRPVLAGVIDVVTSRAQAVRNLLAPLSADPSAIAQSLDEAADRLEAAAGRHHAPALQRIRVAQAWRIAATLARWDAALRAADSRADVLWQSAQRQTQVLEAKLQETPTIPVPAGLIGFCRAVGEIRSVADLSAAQLELARVSVPVRMVNLHLRGGRRVTYDDRKLDESPVAVCLASYLSSPIVDVFVARPGEAYPIEMTVRLPYWPQWAQRCYVEPVTTLSREALTIPSYEFTTDDVVSDEGGIVLTGVSHLTCHVQQPIHGPTVDCPITVRFVADGRQEVMEVAGYRRLRLRPFDPARDRLTEHPQTDQRLLQMYDVLVGPTFDIEDVRAFCRLFGACVTAAQSIVFDKVFRRGTRVTEGQFHDELEERLRNDPILGGRLTRRDRVAGGFDDLLHDSVIAELKVERDKALTISDCAKFLGQPVQYGIGCGSGLSILVVLDHSKKQAPPGVIENYVGWLQPALHGLADPRYPSMVGVLIINTNLPVPSTWSRSGNAVATVRIA